MSSEFASAVVLVERRKPGQRVRPKVTFNETTMDEAECAAALVEGTVVARLEELLLAEAFVAELEESFGVDVDGALVLAGVAMVAVLPHVFGPPTAEDATERAEVARRIRAAADMPDEVAA